MPADATPEEMLTFQYFNWQESLRLQNIKAVLDERKRQASISSVRRRQLSLSSTGRASPRGRSRLAHLPEDERAAITRNLGLSFMTHDDEGIPVPKTAAGALLSVGAYLKATQPPADDPNATLHRQQLKSLALAVQAIHPDAKTPGGSRDRNIVSSRQAAHDRSGRSRHSEETRKGTRRHRSSRSRSRRSSCSDSYSDREPEPCGALCFTRRIRETRMPKGFN